jgi:hypothetical protein
MSGHTSTDVQTSKKSRKEVSVDRYSRQPRHNENQVKKQRQLKKEKENTFSIMSVKKLRPLNTTSTPSPIVFPRKPVLESPTNADSILFSNNAARNAIAAAEAMLKEAASTKKQKRTPLHTLSSLNSDKSPRTSFHGGLSFPSPVSSKKSFSLGKKPLVKKSTFNVFNESNDTAVVNEKQQMKSIESPALIESSLHTTSSLLLLRRTLRSWRKFTEDSLEVDAQLNYVEDDRKKFLQDIMSTSAFSDLADSMEESDEVLYNEMMVEEEKNEEGKEGGNGTFFEVPTKIVPQEIFSPPRNISMSLATISSVNMTPPPSYDASTKKKRRTVTAKRSGQSGNNFTASSPSRFFEDEELEEQNGNVGALSATTASTAGSTASTAVTTANTTNIMPSSPSKYQQPILISRLQAKVNESKPQHADPSPVKKRRIDDSSNDSAAMQQPSIQSLSTTTTSGLLPPPTLHFKIEKSKNNDNNFAHISTNNTNTTSTSHGTSHGTFSSTSSSTSTTSAAVNATATTTTTDTAAKTTNKNKNMFFTRSSPSFRSTTKKIPTTDSSMTPPLYETDCMYKTKLDAFETALTNNAKSLETDNNFNSLVKILKDMTIVLGDGTMHDDDDFKLRRLNGEKEETKEEAAARRQHEIDTLNVLKSMERASKERKAIESTICSSMIRWKIGYTKKSVVVAAATNDDANDRTTESKDMESKDMENKDMESKDMESKE